MSKAPYYSIGIYAPKYDEFLEIMFRAAYTFGANSVFAINSQWSSYSTPDAAKRKADRYPQYTYFPSFTEFAEEQLLAKGLELILVETRRISDAALPLESFIHPNKAAYLFIGRDSKLPDEILQRASARIKVSDDPLFTPGIAGTVLLYDRHYKEFNA